MSAPGQAAMFASGKRRKGRREHDTQAWPDELLPVSEEFGADVAHTGGYSSGTETRAGQAVARRSTVQWCPTGRIKYSGRSAPFGSQVYYLGTDPERFREFCEALRPGCPFMPRRYS